MIDVSNIDAVVIGGSAGAFAGLKTLLPSLPESLAVPILVVLHVPGDRPSAIPEVLATRTVRPLKEAEDKERLEPGTVYFAPPGYHVLVDAEQSIALSVDAPVHFSRPSIDVLFETAADAFAERLLAIILSGANVDGAAGLQAVAARGGTTIVQRPDEAEQATMPRAAVEAATPSAILSLEQIAAVFARLPGSNVASRKPSAAGEHV